VRWPYPRFYFARLSERLKEAGARVIGFDFVFFGRSVPQDDALLQVAFANKNNIILASSIDENGELELSSLAGLGNKATAGIVTKIQDRDGITRKNLTYLVKENEPYKGFLSWEMQLLKVAKAIDLSTLVSRENCISFRNHAGENWDIPVDPNTKSFFIHFRAHSQNFPRLSLYRVLIGDFDPKLVKDKIVLVGLFSTLFGDLHNTPLGWLPGITLNANAFLTLCAHDFLRLVPKPVEITLAILGLIPAMIFPFLLVILGEILIFSFFSYVLLVKGYIWNYALFPLVVMTCPLLVKKMLRLPALKKYWT
jgi:adenylate cyclase